MAEGFGCRNELVVYAGVPAAMFLANRDPAADLAVMAAARENLRRLAPGGWCSSPPLPFTRDSRGKDEASPMETEGLPPTGPTGCSWNSGCGRTFPAR